MIALNRPDSNCPELPKFPLPNYVSSRANGLIMSSFAIQKRITVSKLLGIWVTATPNVEVVSMLNIHKIRH